MAELSDFFKSLISDLFYYKHAVIFYGKDTSLEGKRNGEPYPGERKIIDEIIKEHGGFEAKALLLRIADIEKELSNLDNPVLTSVHGNPMRRELKSLSKKKDQHFLEIVRDWTAQKNAASRLRDHFEGEPGLSHLYLAATCIALSELKSPRSINLLLSFTPNLDDIVEIAFEQLLEKKRPVPITLAYWEDREHQEERVREIVSNVEGNLGKRLPVIIKLLGDISTVNPVFDKNERGLNLVAFKSWLVQSLRQPVIFIGYDFTEQSIEKILEETRDCSAPIYVINDHALKTQPFKGRPVKYLKSNLEVFTESLISGLEKKIGLFEDSVHRIMKRSDPELRFTNLDDIERVSRRISKISLYRAKGKLPYSDVTKRTLNPIERETTLKKILEICDDQRPLLVLTGSSGTGKSTLMYNMAIARQENYIPLFMDVHTILEGESFESRLALALSCDRKMLVELMVHFHQILEKAGKHLFILVDGLNESQEASPTSLKKEIERFGSDIKEIACRVKIIYSCREVYWREYLQTSPGIWRELYFLSKELILSKYDGEEARLAFQVYQEFYGFIGDFDNLKTAFAEKVRDPLMLRMLAEGYQGEELPSFAPAVKIFEAYETRLPNRFATTVLDYLYEIIHLKYKQAINGKMVNDQFKRRKLRKVSALQEVVLEHKVNDPKHPLKILNDEGIIDCVNISNKVYRFTYDRFFEYLIGKKLNGLIFDPVNGHLKVSLEKIVEKFGTEHFSLLNGLKSELIRGYLQTRNDKLVESVISTVNTTAYVIVQNFCKQVLREMIFESRQLFYDSFSNIIKDPTRRTVLILDVAGDSSYVYSVILDGIFSDSIPIVRRCCQVLNDRYISQDLTMVESFKEHFFKTLIETDAVQERHFRGVIYFSAFIFSIAVSIKNDPIENLKKFLLELSHKTSGLIETNLKLMQKTFQKVTLSEGPLFFSMDDSGLGLEYLWSGFGLEEREKAIKLAELLSVSDRKYSDDEIEVLIFFGNEIKHWNKRNSPNENEVFVYRIENRISQWLLIRKSQTDLPEVISILERMVSSKFWLSIDFALCTLKLILLNVHNKDHEIVKQCYERMLDWTLIFQNECPEFFCTLEDENPFEFKFNPYEMVSCIELNFFTHPNHAIEFLRKKVLSDDIKEVRLSILTLRNFWKSNLAETLETLTLAFAVNDKIVQTWTDRVLREIYILHPREIEELLWKHKIDPTRSRNIKFNKNIIDSVGYSRDESLFFGLIFLQGSKPGYLEQFRREYHRILTSDSFEAYTNELIAFLFTPSSQDFVN